MSATVGGARFTPSLLDATTLEQLFVNRSHQLDDALGRVERAATSEERAAKLFVGPRGAGKTHLLSLVYHRARALPGLGERFQLAWLPEDLWTIGSLDDLAVEILACLEPPPEEDGITSLTAIVEAAARRGPIVVLVENLDTVLQAIGSDGQRRLRALLENHRPMLLIATSTRLGDDLLDQAQPFYGFFDTTTLEPFDIDEAALMLKRIAELNGDGALASRLDEPRARSRLATIAHLAGGQPRVWALLAAGLTVERLDDLVSTLVERFDDLTPYYQQQLDRLSLNERKAVRSLAAAPGAVPVGELAERTGIEARSLAKTITDLRRRGWVVRRTGPLVDLADGRRSYYQLAEPLARLAFQLKEARGRPVALVVEFLKAWFDHELLEAVDDSDELVLRYCQAAYQALLGDAPLAIAKALGDPTLDLFHPDPQAAINPAVETQLLDLDDALAAFQRGDPEPLLRQPPAISCLIEHRLADRTPARQRLDLARLALHGGRTQEWVARLEQLAGPATNCGDETALLLALCHLRLGHAGPVDVLLAQVAASASGENAAALLWGGQRLVEEGESARAALLLEAAIEVTPLEDQFPVVVALEAAYQRSGRAQDVVALWESVTATAEACLGPDHPDTLNNRYSLAMAYLSVGAHAQAVPLVESTLVDQERLSGPDHPYTLMSRCLLGIAYWLAQKSESPGAPDRAIPLFESTLADCERILGRSHPATFRTRKCLAMSYESAGDLARAIPLSEATLADLERILGPDHPDTTNCRNLLARARAESPSSG